MVSICMITYNHEKYIAQAIESVVCQETDFAYQLVIGEDFSTDGTRAICDLYAARYPDKIKLLPSEKNHGMMANAKRTSAECNAKYLAQLEGDDFWIDNKKLQKQVEYLEKHKDVAAVAHNVKELIGNEYAASEIFVAAEKRISLNETGFSMPCYTCSIVQRNTKGDWPSFLDESPIGDWPTISLLMTMGDLIILPDVMSVYRKNSGFWSSQSRLKQITGIIKTIGLMLSAPMFDKYKPFREHLTHTMASYIKEAATLSKSEGKVLYDNETALINYYEEQIVKLNSIFKSEQALSTKVTIPTLIKTFQAKLLRSVKREK